jgi:ACS family hexuronate transporter-like MFS transporter
MDQGQPGAPDAAAFLEARATTESPRALRWLVCALLLVLSTISFTVHQSVSALTPLFRAEFSWDAATLGWIHFGYLLALGVSSPFVGRLVDRIGVKAALIWGAVIASVAALGHVLAASLLGFMALSVLIGLGEAALAPASIKAIAEWFPIRQRAFVAAITALGTNAGVIATPVIVIVATTFGWRSSFIVAGCAGLAWVAAWAALYRSPSRHPELGDAERAPGDGRPVSVTQVPWLSVLGHRQFWGYALGRMLSGTAAGVLLWIPAFASKRGASSLEVSLLLALSGPAMAAGGLIGGSLSWYLIHRGRSVGSARLVAMTAAAAGMTILALGAVTDNLGVTMCLVAVASFCHGIWNPNMATLASDLFPTNVVGTVVSLGGLAATLGSMFVTVLGALLPPLLRSGELVFVIAGLLQPLAVLALVSVAGRDLRPVPIESLRPATLPS